MANELIKELSPHRHWLVYKKELVTKPPRLKAPL